MVETFRKGIYLINIWGEIFEHNYPGQEDLLDLIPNANYLIIPKLLFGGNVETDTCNGVKKI